MESPSPALILASRRRALTGSSRSLSRAYNKGELVRVRTGVPPTTRAAKDPKTGLTGLEKVRGYGVCRHHWETEVVQARGFGVTSFVQTVMDSVVRLELPEAVAVAGTVLGSRRKEGEGLTRIELQQASAGLAAAAKRRRGV